MHDNETRRTNRRYAGAEAVGMLKALPENELQHLCSECGVIRRELERYVPAILRRKEAAPTLDLF